jgi:hypothetical protein
VVEEPKLAYRLRTATVDDDTALRTGVGTTLAHPDKHGKRESYRGAASRGDILLLERYDRQEREWRVAGFLEFHLRVDDTLSIRDLGTTGEEPQAGAVRYLLDEAFGSFKPIAAQVKIRRDALAWLEIFRSVPGFYLEGEEYRRPHYWTVWRWDPARARETARPGTPPMAPTRPSPPRPPGPRAPTGGARVGRRPTAPGPGGRRHDNRSPRASDPRSKGGHRP